MSVVTIALNNKNIQIACNDGEEAKVIEAAHMLSEKIDLMKSSNPTASSELLLIFAALELQDTNIELQNKLQNTPHAEDEKIAETLSTIANYLEELAKKITK